MQEQDQNADSENNEGRLNILRKCNKLLCKEKLCKNMQEAYFKMGIFLQWLVRKEALKRGAMLCLRGYKSSVIEHCTVTATAHCI